MIAFVWLVLHGSILNMNDPGWWKRIVLNACPMCLVDEKTNHLLLNSQVVK